MIDVYKIVVFWEQSYLIDLHKKKSSEYTRNTKFFQIILTDEIPGVPEKVP